LGLKRIAHANSTFANDHDGLFAAEISTNENGAREFVSNGDAYKHFQCLSNELGTPRFLVCPQDSRVYAREFRRLANTNISYFAGLDASSNHPKIFLAGDRNLMVNGASCSNAVARVRAKDSLDWASTIHDNKGYVVLVDGRILESIAPSSHLNVWLEKSGTAQRLSFP
jgi:hypothetical protein